MKKPRTKLEFLTVSTIRKLPLDKITLNKYPSFDQYKYLKELRILEFDPDFYTKYHDYFELEIQANVYGAKQTIKELKK